MKTEETYLGREITTILEFTSTGTFTAIREAEEYLKENGYTVGSMCRNEPIGFANSAKYEYVAKWYNIDVKDRKHLDGVIISNDFREGNVQILFFN
jgi:hypothetical protein